MRLLFAALVLLGLSAAAAAQTAVPAPRVTTPLPPIGLPLPRIGLPLPPIASSAPRPPVATIPQAPSAARSRPGRPQDGGRDSSRRRSPRHAPRGIYVVPGYGWPYPAAAETTAQPRTIVPEPEIPPVRPTSARGTLRLDVPTDPQAQVYIDGFFAGTLSELPADVELTEGTHRIELRGERYQPLVVDVTIAAGRSITYRGALVPSAGAAVAAAASASAAPSKPTTVYLIPGCYLGNVPPKDAGLPATCDLSRVTTFEP